ncbi:MAG: hypothetical protein IJD95_06215 [Clostridia bacterium]|nr:hypothetical protein [Clostridia bacterium]
MKKIITVISVTIALALTLLSFSGCTPRIIQGTFELTPSENLFYAKGSTESSMEILFDSFEDYEKDIADDPVIRFEPVGKSFNVFKNQYTFGVTGNCYTVTPVKIKEVIYCGEEYDLKVGDIIYFTDWYVYITEEVYNARKFYSNRVIDDFKNKIGGYEHVAAYDSPWKNFVFLKEGEEYIARVFLIHHYWNGRTEKSFIFEKNGVEFELFHAAFEGTFPITEEIDRSKFTHQYLMLYDGVIAKYGNNQSLE